MNYSVYCHTNKVNGKRYIGITSVSPQKRWANGKGYRGMVFGRAIKKYGWDGFYHEILITGLTETEALKKESELIQSFKSYNPRFGYNQSILGTVPTAKTRKKLSVRMTGESNPMYHKPRPENNLKATRKAVICTDTQTVYESISEASRKTGINLSNIARCCKSKRQTAGGLHWQFRSA